MSENYANLDAIRFPAHPVWRSGVLEQAARYYEAIGDRVGAGRVRAAAARQDHPVALVSATTPGG